MGLENVKNVIVVMSGKGGVGKSSVSAMLTLALCSLKNTHGDYLKIGLLDTDICGPSLPRVFKCAGSKVLATSSGSWSPVALNLGVGPALKIFSIGFLLPEGSQDAAIIWRGPKKTSMIDQMLNKVDWGHLDYLVIDTPPGTSDEHISLASNLESFKKTTSDFHYHALLVTTPQLVSLADVERQVNFCLQINLPIIGVLENMSGWTCSKCHNVTNVLSQGGGQQLADKYNLKFLGNLPLASKLAHLFDDGVESVDQFIAIEEIYPIILDIVVNKVQINLYPLRPSFPIMDIQPPRKDKKTINLIGSFIFIVITFGIVGYNYHRISENTIKFRNAAIKCRKSLEQVRPEMPERLFNLYSLKMNTSRKDSFIKEIDNYFTQFNKTATDLFDRFLQVSEDHLDVHRRLLIMLRVNFDKEFPNPTKGNFETFYNVNPYFICIYLHNHIIFSRIRQFFHHELVEDCKKYILRNSGTLSPILAVFKKQDAADIAAVKNLLEKLLKFAKELAADYQNPQILHPDYPGKSDLIEEANGMIQRIPELLA
jgi:Mrp family chromosome partitioning ATPase